jgi:hypothetical protein
MKLTAAITILLAVQLVAAPPPKLVREIDLNQILPASPGCMPITTYAFSPDEKWLARLRLPCARWTLTSDTDKVARAPTGCS